MFCRSTRLTASKAVSEAVANKRRLLCLVEDASANNMMTHVHTLYKEKTYPVIFAYTVYAMQFSLWRFPCMGLALLMFSEQMSLLSEVEAALEWVRCYTNYSIEHHVAMFLHHWHFHPSCCCGISDVDL